MKCNNGIDQKINYCGLCEWKRAETALIQVRELEAMLLRINEHVFPGTSDSIDGLKRLVRERDQYYTEAKRQAERIAELEHERDQWKKECRGLQPGEPIWRRLADYQNENAKQAERIRLWKTRCRRYKNERNYAMDAHEESRKANLKLAERVSYLEQEIEQIRCYADNEQVEMVCKRALSQQDTARDQGREYDKHDAALRQPVQDSHLGNGRTFNPDCKMCQEEQSAQIEKEK